MAVTINDTPQLYTPSDNPVSWDFSSDQTAQDNFVYIVDVYINNVLTATEFVFPDNGINGRFDASSYCSNATQQPTISQTLIDDANNYAYCRITVTERYGTPPANQASAVGTNITVWKARMTDTDFVVWKASGYILDGISNRNWLTNFPGTNNPKVAETDEQIRIMCINNLINITNFKVILYDSGGGVVASDQLNQAVTTERMLILNISPAVIVASALVITTANFADASYYTVEINLGTGFLAYRIDIDREHVYSTYKRIHFMTKWGTIEAYSFGLISRESANIKSFGYRKGFGEWDGNSFVYTNEQGRDIDYAKFAQPRLVVESDWLDQDIQNWMVENLHESPLVYEEFFTTGALIRRKIMNGSSAKKIQENDMLFLEKITLGLPERTSMIL